jgi:hypothetical protein
MKSLRRQPQHTWRTRRPPDGGAKKGGRLSAAFESREETPKEGTCGQTHRTDAN